MIWHCPYCGQNLVTPINNGITSCRNCCRIFDSSPYHRILSAFWIAHKQNLVPEQLTQRGFTQEEADFVIDNVDLTYQEFSQVIDGMGVSRIVA